MRVRALIRLLPTEAGGLDYPVRGDYRPGHDFELRGGRAIGRILVPDGAEIAPGEALETTVEFFDWDELDAVLQPGRAWRICHGARVVGWGEVLEILA